MNTKYLDLYTDYLAVTFGYATATGLSGMLDGSISHDKFTRFLASGEWSSKDSWEQVKSTVREVESEDGVLIFDDTVQEKPWMDENDLVCRHYDHCKGRSIKGINMLNCLYHVSDVSIPVAFELIQKPIRFSDLKTRREKRRSEVTKNELLRSMVDTCMKNRIKFTWILFDSWFSSVENLKHIKLEHKKEVIGALKSNRLVALTEEDRKNKRFTRIDQIEWPGQGVVTGWLNGLKFPVCLARQIFTNKDGSSGVLYLACTRLTADWNTITTIYKKRWNVEVYHKSLKSNAALAKSPARRVNAQSNHIFASVITVFKMECLKIKTKMNHFALKSKLYLKAVRSAFDELRQLQAA
jgi:hypothetical protein